MADLNSWLFPQPHATSEEVAAFWPDTGFTVVPAFDRLAHALPQTLDSGAAMSAGFLEYAALVGHEQTHWIQANASAYGRFLARIDHARSEIAESFIGMYTAEQVESLTRRRLKGQPVLRLTPNQRCSRRPELGPIGEILQRHWWGLGLLRHEFEASDRVRGALAPSAYLYGLAILYAQAGPQVSQVALIPPNQLKEMARELAPAGSYVRALAQCEYPELSSEAIAECGAVLNQHWTYAHAAESLRRRGDHRGAARLRRTHRRSWVSKEPTPYGDAFRAFAHFCPDLDLNAARPLHTLGIAAFLAMDGNFSPDVQAGRATWLDVSPPLRFLRLVKAVRRVGVVPADVLCELTPKKTRAYCDDLIDAAGLPQWRHRRPPRTPAHSRERSPITSLRSLMHDAHVASLQLHRTLPAALIAPGETAVFCADELESGPLKAHSLARLPPLLSIGGSSRANGITPARFAECGVGGAYQRLLLQLMADTGSMRLAGLPTDAAGRAMVQRAITVLRERTERPVAMSIETADGSTIDQDQDHQPGRPSRSDPREN